MSFDMLITDVSFGNKFDWETLDSVATIIIGINGMPYYIKEDLLLFCHHVKNLYQ